MNAALETVVSCLKEKGWEFDVDEAQGRVRSAVTSDNGEWTFFVAVDDGDGVCMTVSVFPQRCPANRRRVCLELLARINWTLRLGCFEMDCDSGRIGFRTACPFSPGRVDGDRVRQVLGFNIAFMDRMFPVIMSVLYGSVSPRRALEVLDRKARRDRVNDTKRHPRAPRLQGGFMNN
jgi:hypothetical protein